MLKKLNQLKSKYIFQFPTPQNILNIQARKMWKIRCV